MSTAFGYELLEPLGESSSGQTWRARDPRTGRVLALKHPRPGVHPPELLREAHRALEHALASSRPLPGAPELLGVTPPDATGGFAVLTELVVGRDLAQIAGSVDLSMPGRLESFLRVFEHIAHVVGDLHQRGVVHGNLSRGNILLGSGERSGQVLLLDLPWSRAGLARPRARPPEMQDGSPARPGSDQWFLSRLLLDTAPAWPAALDRVLRRPLERASNPVLAERFPRIEQLASALEAARLEVLGSQDLPLSGETPTFGLEGEPTEGREPPPRAAAESDGLDAASLAPTLETGQVGPAPSDQTEDVSLALDLSREAATPSSALPKVSPSDPTRSIRAPAATRRLPLALAGAAATVALLGLGLALGPSPERFSQPAGLGSPPTSTAARRSPAAPPARPEAPREPEPPEKGDRGARPRERPPRGTSTPPCRSDTPRACRRRGRAALARGRPRRARRLFERACDARDAAACVALAKLWARGAGGPRRARTAAAFRRRACALGHGPSCTRGPESGGRSELDGLKANQ